MKKNDYIRAIFFMLTTPVFLSHGAPIEDNSFLIEEAYNQEEGIVQFIQSVQTTKTPSEELLNYSFTNEIPVGGQNHQFSYVIPYLKSKKNSLKKNGIGDVSLNYRYQLVNSELISIAPRLSLVLPTGNHRNGFGTDAFGIQGNLAISVLAAKNFVTHWNMGYTLTPKAKGQLGNTKATTLSTNFGASMVYLMRDNFNFLVELVHNSNEISNGDGTTSREESYVVNPGVRFAIDYPTTQIVPGLTFPIGIGASRKNDIGVIAYLSIEPKLW